MPGWVVDELERTDVVSLDENDRTLLPLARGRLGTTARRDERDPRARCQCSDSEHPNSFHEGLPSNVPDRPDADPVILDEANPEERDAPMEGPLPRLRGVIFSSSEN